MEYNFYAVSQKDLEVRKNKKVTGGFINGLICRYFQLYVQKNTTTSSLQYNTARIGSLCGCDEIKFFVSKGCNYKRS